MSSNKGKDANGEMRKEVNTETAVTVRERGKDLRKNGCTQRQGHEVKNNK